MRKILLSVATLGVVAALVTGATSAFFSDTETSSGNTFTAGSVDLRVDSEAHYAGMTCVENTDEDQTGNDEQSADFIWVDDERPGVEDPTRPDMLGTACSGTWAMTDLGPEHTFFDYGDLKPGDSGENTISLHVDSNDAYACAVIDDMQSDDNGLVEPEEEAGDDTGGDGEGELHEELHFFAWNDGQEGDDSNNEPGNNIWEVGEEPLFDNRDASADEVLDGQSYPLFTPDETIGDTDRLTASSTQYIGMYWCYGEIDVDEDNNELSCDGQEVSNMTQTDSLSSDISFYVEQARNNSDFECPAPEDINKDEDGDEGDGDRAQVGADLASYQAPGDDCDTTVDTTQGLVDALADASENETICVADGDYDLDGPLTIDTNGVTLASVNGPTNTATITGGIFVNANNVTVTGFIFDGYDHIASSENAAIYIHNEPGQGAGTNLDGTTVSHNIFNAPGDAKDSAVFAKGVITEIGNSSAHASGITVKHNEFNDWRQAMFFNTSNHDVHHNDIYGNDVGVANDGPDSSSIHHNDFEDNDLEAVGVNPSAESGTGNDGVLTVNMNNLAPAGGDDSGNEVNHYGVDNDSAGPDVDATNNWWDGEASGDRVGNNPSEVDTSSAESTQFPEN